MAVKMSGAEFKAFMAYLEALNPQGYIEDETIYVGDSDVPLSCEDIGYEAQIDDTDAVMLVDGYWMEPGDGTGNDLPYRLERKAEAWLDKMRSDIISVITIRAPKNRVDDVKRAIASLGDFSVVVS